MSKKSKSRSEREFLRGEIRRLKAELKACKAGHVRDDDDEEYEDLDEDGGQIICDDCGKGELIILDLGRAVYSRCTICLIRKKL